MGGEFALIGMCTHIPDDLEKADVEQYNNVTRLLGSAPWQARPVSGVPSTLEEARQALPSADVWAAEILLSTDEGTIVAASIRAGTAYAVSDGSYKEDRGTSAFLLEGASGAEGRIIGMNAIPGDATDQSAYRAELGGISGVIATVDCLCRLHRISSGAIQCRLDGYQAMRHASGADPLDPKQASFDLLVDIRNKILLSPITWTFHWVEGHQAERHGSEDFWGNLNNVCDSVAKTFWNQVSLIRETQPNHRFSNEGWSVHVQGRKLAKLDLTELYNLTFGEDTSRPYWTKKHSIAPQLFTSIDWERCGKAMKTILFGKKRWLVKHLTGFCAVGRMMKIRQEWSHDLCPLCLQPDETTDHVVVCPDPRARLQWFGSIDKLGVTLKKLGTEPAIADLIRKRLLHIRSTNVHRFTLPENTPKAVKLAVAHQDLIGWAQFLRGRLSKKWKDAQELWIIAQSTKWKRSSGLWTEKLIRALWEVVWEMWEYRNSVRHHPLHPWNRKKQQDLDDSIQHEFDRYRDAEFLQVDRRLFRSTAKHMIEEHSTERKEQWIQSVEMARLRQLQTQLLATAASSLLMRNWLLRAPASDAEGETPGPEGGREEAD